MPDVTSVFHIEAKGLYYYFRIYYTSEGKLIKIIAPNDNALIYREVN